MRRLLQLTVVLLAVLGSAGCGSDSGGETSGATGGATAAAGADTVALTTTEFKYDPAAVTVDEAGKVTFTVTNDGSCTSPGTTGGSIQVATMGNGSCPPSGGQPVGSVQQGPTSTTVCCAP